MKNDLAASIGIAILGIVMSYFVCNLFAGEADNYSFSSVSADAASASLDEPDPEIFNYKALNPTVEVYVGNCTELNEYGECIDTSSSQIETGIIEEDTATEDLILEETDITEESTSTSQRKQ